MKRIAGLLLGVVLLFSIAACANDPPDYWENYDPDNFIADTGNPQIVKEKVSIRLFAPKGALQGDWNDMALWQEMERITNIHIDWECVPMTSYAEKRGLKWLDTVNPADAFFLCNTMSEAATASQNNRIAALEDLIEEYAPNYSAWIEQYPEIKNITSYDGHMYIFSSVSTVGGEFAMQYINQEWLDNLGLSMPQTIDEFYNVLYAFKTQDGNGNGIIGDETPISLVSGDATMSFLMSAFGFIGTGMECDVNNNNEIVYVPYTQNYREFVKMLNKMYKSGVLDANIYSNKSGDLAQMGQNNRLGCFSDAAAMLTVGTEMEDNYVPIGPLTSSVNSQKMHLQFSYDFNPNIFMINNDTPYKRELVRWIDTLYDVNTEPLQSVGIENVHWKWDNEEKTTYSMIIPDGMTQEQFRATITYQAGLGTPILKTEFSQKSSNELEQKLNVEREAYRDYLRTGLPQLSFTSEQSREKADIEAQLNSYVGNMEANFVKGNIDPNDDGEWNEFISKITQIGGQRLIEIYKEAYQTYLNQGGNS